MQAVYDAKSEEIGPGVYRFKAEIGESVQPCGSACHPSQPVPAWPMQCSKPHLHCVARRLTLVRPNVCGCSSELLPYILYPRSQQWPNEPSVADFCGEKVVERHMSRLGREPLYECITAASKTRDSKAMELVLMEYGEN